MKITILWIFILYLINFFTYTNQSNVIFRYNCPQGCFCVPDIINTELLIISCRWQKLNLIKESFPKNVTKSLTIQCLKEKDQNENINNNLFNDFNNIQELRIMHCKINDLNAEKFREISTLQSLYLLNISTTSLTLNYKFLKQFKNLEKLTLVKSQLEMIETGALCAIPKLQILNLSYNQLKNANIGVHTTNCIFPHLIIFDLSHNNIEYLSNSEFNSFPSIRQLSISSNRLKKIDDDAFKSIHLIRNLDLDNNELLEMVPLSDSILHINLAQNKLTTIPATVANLLSLISLNISENLINLKTPFSLISNSIEIIDLSKNQFTEIPLRLVRESMDTILNLNLANNAINQIKPFELQNFSHIKELELSNNNIKSLPYGIFNGLNELTTLKINNNSIYHIDIEVFNDLNKKLTTLEIENNQLTELPMAIGRLSKIKTINLSGNKISKTYKFVLNKITHLTKLDLSNNQLQEIDNYVFSDSVHLTDLILRNNQIKVISNNAFERCPRLKKLDLSKNQLNKLETSLIQIRSLRTLNLSNNNFDHLEWDEIPNELHDLYILNNNIKSISKIKESHVKILNIKNNKIKSIEAEQLPSLIEEIDISYNQLQQISKYSFVDKTQLKFLNLQNNMLKTVPNGIFDQSLVINANFPGKFYLSNNPLVCNCEMSWVLNATAKQIAVNIADDTKAECALPFLNKKKFLYEAQEEDFLCRYNQTCEPGCICCQYGNCDCKSKCPDGCECFRDNNYKINIIKCYSKTRQKIIIRDLPMYASHIYLNKVNLPVLRSHDFIGRSKLTQLHITSSNLQTIEPLAFNTLPKLQILNLSDNKLQRINGDESFKTQRLQMLNIEKNKIIEIDTRLSEIMPNLEILQASKNKFETLPKYLEKDKTKNKLKRIYLGDNQFRCDCSVTNKFKAQIWFQENKNRVYDLKNVFCVENITQALQTNDTTVLTSFAPNYKNELFMIPMFEFLNIENKSLCITESKGIFGGANAESTIFLSLITFFLLFLLIAIIIYSNNKKKVEQKYKRANSFSPDNSVESSPLPSGPLIQYDVFVSYSINDEKTVVQQLCRPLEIQDYSLCLLHHVGSFNYNNGLHTINDELNKQLKTCQTLLIFITKSFLENEWKTVQIRTSHKIFAKIKNKKLIAIISDEVKTNELDDELGQILRKNTCIQQSHQLFWNLLMSALPERECSMLGSETSQIYSDAAYGSIVPSEIV